MIGSEFEMLGLVDSRQSTVDSTRLSRAVSEVAWHERAPSLTALSTVDCRLSTNLAIPSSIP